ncbi:MAG: HupE/UreJ family protein [Nitrospinota bacterium]
MSNSIITVENRTVNYYLSVPPNLFYAMRRLVGKNRSDQYAYMADSVKISVKGADCRLMWIQGPDPQKSGNIIYHTLFECPKDADAFTFTSSLFFDIDERHLQFVRVAYADKPAVFLYEGVLSSTNPDFEVESLKAGGSLFINRLYSFFSLGVEHLLTGYDHILFLLSVILVTASFMSTLKVITSFTIAHSITLALAFTGTISLPSAIVEPLIAATIIYVSIENLFRSDFSNRWIVTFFFGLVHGLGFVGALKDITVSTSELATSVVSFNIGIEICQIAIIAVFFPILHFIRKQPWGHMFERVASVLIAISGTYWLVTRLL